MLHVKTITADDQTVDKIHKEGSIECVGRETQFVILKGPTKSALAAQKGQRLYRVTDKLAFRDLKSRDKEQACLLYAMQSYDLTVGVGHAGTGKTTLACAYAIHKLFKTDKRIVFCKPTSFVGGRSNAIAAVPGDMREKISPYMESFMGPLEKLFGEYAEHHLVELENSKKVIFQPLEMIRGMNYENSIVILDEAQNTTKHEILSLISRVSQSSSCIILGDPSQIDTGVLWEDTGLYALCSSNTFKESDLAIGIELKNQYRGPLATFAYEVSQYG